MCSITICRINQWLRFQSETHCILPGNVEPSLVWLVAELSSSPHPSHQSPRSVTLMVPLPTSPSTSRQSFLRWQIYTIVPGLLKQGRVPYSLPSSPPTVSTHPHCHLLCPARCNKREICEDQTKDSPFPEQQNPMVQEVLVSRCCCNTTILQFWGRKSHGSHRATITLFPGSPFFLEALGTPHFLAFCSSQRSPICLGL